MDLNDILHSILEQCPGSDAEQLKLLQDRYGGLTLEDFQGAVVFGAERLGLQISKALEDNGIHVMAFSDNDSLKWGTGHGGLKVVAPKALDLNRPIIITSKYVKEIYADLLELGATKLVPHYVLSLMFSGKIVNKFHRLSAAKINSAKETIAKAFSLLEDRHSKDLFLSLLKFRITLDPLELPDPSEALYFPGAFWKLSSREVFVDVGACTGDTLEDFLRVSNGSFKKYLAIEADPHNFKILQKSIPESFSERILAFPLGAGAKRHQVPFLFNQGGESRVDLGASSKVEVVPLDELLFDETVSTIKIDVEGYEKEVLEGARRTIVQQSPKLAVSVYHNIQDLWEIPLWLERNNPGYKFYLRHHTPEIYDTVLYCVPVGEA
ncbi:MAG: FkbM family methyltransferase [SAR324 cluster bacterium]|uniref:FkbM family methyltransferase n=1 Tax=SAR324 cluster bacterium TaxID=2024889 RepID=A0A7X9ILR1_9DELT|nr:FkbM family methyltransferase [SAR324 cluster bacterium]